VLQKTACQRRITVFLQNNLHASFLQIILPDTRAFGEALQPGGIRAGENITHLHANAGD